GGLLTAVAKEAIDSGVGVVLDDKNYTAAELFGEGATVAVYAVPADKAEAFRSCWKNVPVEQIGVVGGESLKLGSATLATVAELNSAFRK
ncbi:MAG: phosphoribosylformylglycinamidine synthase subunit PurL, partial [Pyramidobacter sp.]|nr:phosphoribosylformylglycinamidine synthase subunit PurL [Pyramidobacter sp.]